MKKIRLVLFLALNVVLFYPSLVRAQDIVQQEETKVYNVNVEQFSKLVDANKGVVLDVRTPGEWEEGTIGDAIKINY